MGEAQTPHFYEFWIFEPVTKPQNQLFLFLETPGYLKTSEKNPQTFFKHMIVIHLEMMETHKTEMLEKTGTEESRISV